MPAYLVPDGATNSRLTVHVVPRASRTETAGEYGDALRIRLAAPPVDGKANKELLRFLAERLSLPASAPALVSGQTGRRKVVLLPMSPGEVAARLEK